MHAIRSIAMLLAATFLLAGCATKTYYTSDKLDRGQGKPAILLMPPDVELSELSAGGVPEVNAAWTKAGASNVDAAVKEHLQSINVAYRPYQAPPEDSDDFLRFDNLQKLHGTVGNTIATFHANEAMRLPAKKGKFEWSMGPGVTALARDSKADYALFVYVRDSYASGGRVAMKIMAAVLFGVHVPAGIQTGYASLVDLRTGEVVWTNFLLPREEGDLRTPPPARATVATLLTGFPK